MNENTDKYILMGLWAAVALAVIWFFAAGLSIYALFWVFILTGVAFIWWGLRMHVTEKIRAWSLNILSIFWTVIALFMFFPFSPPDPVEYIVGEVHRFSEMNHGFGRCYMGALGPNLNNHGYVYTKKDLIEPLAKARGGRKPSFTTTTPISRGFFGATTLTDMLRAPNQLSGEPVKVLPYPWTSFKGAARDHKLGWNQGDLLMGNVAGKLGYEKAKYTPEENALMIKELGLWMGSMDVGISKVDPRWYYSHDLMTAGRPTKLEDLKHLKYG
ncbi:MAG: 4Fe-4S ferredoxin, partial [Deltaproteobacteria bacterium]|nr:4Fe-4S ferredoxin [Deltaproteobacteria bacterium]